MQLCALLKSDLPKSWEHSPKSSWPLDPSLHTHRKPLFPYTKPLVLNGWRTLKVKWWLHPENYSPACAGALSSVDLTALHCGSEPSSVYEYRMKAKLAMNLKKAVSIPSFQNLLMPLGLWGIKSNLALRDYKGHYYPELLGCKAKMQTAVCCSSLFETVWHLLK